MAGSVQREWMSGASASRRGVGSEGWGRVLRVVCLPEANDELGSMAWAKEQSAGVPLWVYEGLRGAPVMRSKMLFQAPPARTQISPLVKRESLVEWSPAPDAHLVQPLDEARGGAAPPNSGRS